MPSAQSTIVGSMDESGDGGPLLVTNKFPLLIRRRMVLSLMVQSFGNPLFSFTSLMIAFSCIFSSEFFFFSTYCSVTSLVAATIESVVYFWLAIVDPFGLPPLFLVSDVTI